MAGIFQKIQTFEGVNYLKPYDAVTLDRMLIGRYGRRRINDYMRVYTNNQGVVTNLDNLAMDIHVYFDDVWKGKYDALHIDYNPIKPNTLDSEKDIINESNSSEKVENEYDKTYGKNLTITDSNTETFNKTYGKGTTINEDTTYGKTSTDGGTITLKETGNNSDITIHGKSEKLSYENRKDKTEKQDFGYEQEIGTYDNSNPWQHPSSNQGITTTVTEEGAKLTETSHQQDPTRPTSNSKSTYHDLNLKGNPDLGETLPKVGIERSLEKEETKNQSSTISKTTISKVPTDNDNPRIVQKTDVEEMTNPDGTDIFNGVGDGGGKANYLNGSVRSIDGDETIERSASRDVEIDNTYERVREGFDTDKPRKTTEVRGPVVRAWWNGKPDQPGSPQFPVDTLSKEGTEIVSNSGTDKIDKVIDESKTETRNVSNTLSGKDTTNITNSGSDTETGTIGDDRSITKEGADTEEGSVNTTKTNSGSGTVSEKNTETGNKWWKSPQELLTEELELRKNNLYKDMLEDVVKLLTLSVY